MVDWNRYVPKEAVVFVDGLPKKLHFTGLIDEATIEAKKLGVLSPVSMSTLVLGVDMEDDKPVIKKWYIASKKAIMTMKPYVEDGTYKRRVFSITKHGVAPAAYFEIVAGPIG